MESDLSLELLEVVVISFGDGTRTSSVLMQSAPHMVRFVDSIHVPPDVNVKVRF